MKESTIDLIALSKGNTQAFDCLFLLYYPKVRTFIYSILDNEEEAEDLAQDTFIKLWTARAQLSHVQNINAYIYQTAKHVLYTFLDKKINTRAPRSPGIFMGAPGARHVLFITLQVKAR